MIAKGDQFNMPSTPMIVEVLAINGQEVEIVFITSEGHGIGQTVWALSDLEDKVRRGWYSAVKVPKGTIADSQFPTSII